MMSLKNTLGIFIFLLLTLQTRAQDSLTINLAAIGLIEGEIESMTDNILINVTNNYGIERNVYFVVGIVGQLDDGTILNIDNQMSASDNVVNIGPAGFAFTLTNLIDQYQNSSLEDYNITPASFFALLQSTRQLPAGSYNICLEARSIYNNQIISAPGANNCLAFTIHYRNPPIIQSPENNTWVGYSDLGEVQVIWAHDDPGPSTTYNLEIVRFPSQSAANDFLAQGSPHQLFESYERILLEEGITAWNYNTLNADVMPNLEAGDVLAVRVTAVSESSIFVNNGKSNINVFFYGVPDSELCNNPSIYADWAFPSIGDTLPFPDIFPVARFEPSCDNILELDADIHFARSMNGALVGTTTVLDYNDNWRSGPGPSNYLHDYFQRHFPSNMDFFYPSGSDYEQYIPFLHDNGSFSAQRGEQVNIFGGLTFTKRVIPGNTITTQGLSLNAMNTHGVVIGMPTPQLQSPANDAVMQPGNIQFEFSTGLEPGNPLPPFKIFRLEGFHDPIVPGLSVNEKCVLQISKDPSFNMDSIVFCKLKKIQGNPYDNSDNFNEDNPNFEPISNTFDLTSARQFDQAHYLQQVYKSIAISNDFNEEDTLYWRVIWLRFPDAYNISSPCGSGIDITSADYYHASPVRRLIISEDAGESPPVVTEESESSDSSGCSAPCTFPLLTDTHAIGGVEAGSTFKAAGFTVEVATSNGGSSSNGTGRVIIPFLNNVKVRVNFSSITINAARQMIGGNITPIVEQAIPLSQHASTLGQLFSMDETAADAMEAGLEAGGKLMSLLASGSEVSLPIGIDKDISGTKIIIGITEMTFKKDTAHMNLVVNIKIPNLEVVNGFVSLGAKVCITKDGFGNDVKLYLPQDQVFPMGNENEFRLKGADGAIDETNVTSVEWDCNGFRALNLVGAVRFTRDWLLPEDPSGHIMPTGQVEARMRGHFTQGGQVMVRLDMDPFQIPGADGWGFTPAHNTWIDLSDLENPTGFMDALPAGYHHASLTADGMQNTWKGFFMEELSVRTPEQLQGPDHNRLTFALRNMFIDNTGISFSARAENILRWDGNGDMAGWAASLDTIFFDISQNNFHQMGFNGKLGLPIADATQYMLYQAALTHHNDSFNLVISVRPAENIRIPISMATATIRSDSYVEVSLGTDTYIEAGLSATLTIGNSNLPSGQSMAGTMSMPGIVIENLVVNSETGFDTTNFAFSLTGMGSPGGGGGSGGGDYFKDDDGRLIRFLPAGGGESTLSGFPIGLDHFSFSNDKITIQPRITLTGSEGGFSAAAKVSLLVDMDLMSSPQRFDVTGVQLERIDLDIEASDITLAGYLEFYKSATDEGVRGGLTVGLNLGMRIGIDINADFGTRKLATATQFNTAEWYSYFYVDGTVVFTPGITLFSGVSLYGLGGGFYHHMQMANTLPSGGAVLTGAGRPSGVRYEPHFATDLGLKFMVILGSNDNGQAYNLDVQLQAEFSFVHGLTYIGLQGSFRVMGSGISISTVGRDDASSPVSGYVGMSLNMPPAGPTTFNGQFFVKLKIPASSPMLRGIGTIPNPPTGWTSDNAMVWAVFKASDSENYFHMGTPSNRGGIRLSFGGSSSLLEVTTYLMIGDGIPVVMPEPHADFIRIFNHGMPTPVQSLDGDINELMAGNPRDSDPTGSGFAFGLTLAMRTGDIDLFPFFFNLSAIMGCDINVTKASPEADRRCAGTDRIPGTDGWYATGQFYAGIEGAFGIKINLFVEEIKVNILQASAAIILRGGLPNPEWVSGRGSFYYNVCDGLAEGNCNFTFEAGTVCIPVTGNPFGGVSLIQDIDPHDGATNVSVYTDVSAAFSMDMNKIYEFEEYTTAIDPPAIRRIQPYMKSFELRKVGRSVNLAGQGVWSEDNHVYTYSPINRLDPNSAHTIRVEARIKENGRDLLIRGAVFKEERTHTFTTGAEPDRIVDENLNFTYPYISQQNFYKGETRNNEGYIKCNRANNGFFQEGDVSDVITTFTAKFTDEDNNVITTPARIMPGASGAIFNVSQLLPDKLYAVQLIRKDEPRDPTTASSSNATGTIYDIAISSGLLNNIRSTLNITNLVATVGANTINSNQYKRIELPTGKVGRYEREVYSYFFKTSKHITLAQKMMQEASGWVNESVTFGLEFGRVKKDMTEPFEWVDVDEFKMKPRSIKTFTKRINFILQSPPDMLDGVTETTPIPVNQYLKDIVSRHVMLPYSQALSNRADVVRRVGPMYPGMSVNVPMIPSIGGYNNYNASTYFNSTSNYRRPLTQDAINAAFTVYLTNNDPLALALSQNSMNVNFDSPQLLGLFGSLASNSKTVINYEPTIEGFNQYKQLRNRLVNFAHGNITINLGIVTTSVNVWDKLTPAQQTFFNSHINRNTVLSQMQYMNWTKGPQVIGLRYLFPDQNGNDVQGTLSTLQFRL